MSRYFVDGYLDANYFDETVVDTGTYYVDGYLDSGYFVNDAVGSVQEASATLISAFGVASTVNRIRQGNAAFVDAFIPTITASGFKNSTAIIDSVFTVTSTVNVVLGLNSNLITISNTSVDVNRIRDTNVNMQIIGSVTATATNIIGETEAAANLIALFPAIAVDINVIKQTQSVVNSTVVVIADAGVIKDTNSNLQVIASNNTVNERIGSNSSAIISTSQTIAIASRSVQGDSSVQAAFTTQSAAGKIHDAEIQALTLFTTGVTVVATKNSFAILDNVVSMLATVNTVRDNDLTLNNIVTLSLQAARSRDIQLSASASFIGAISEARFRDTNSSLAFSFVVGNTDNVNNGIGTNTVNSVTRQTGAVVVTASALTANANIIKSTDVNLQAITSTISSADRIRSTSADFTAFYTTANPITDGSIGIGGNSGSGSLSVTLANATLTSSFSLYALEDIRPLQVRITNANGNAQNGATASSTTRFKIGSASIKSGTQYDAVSAFLTDDIFNVGTGDFTFEYWIDYNGYNVNLPSIYVDDTASGPAADMQPLSFLYVTGTSVENLVDGSYSNAFRFETQGTGTYVYFTAELTTVVGEFNHIAVVRNNNFIDVYLDGIKQTIISGANSNGKFDASGFDFDTVDRFMIYPSTLQHYYDEIRLSTTARYTSNFQTRLTPFSNDADTVLLIHGDGNVKDSIEVINTAELYATTSLTADLTETKTAELGADATATLQATANIIRSIDAAVSTQTSLQASTSKIQQLASDTNTVSTISASAGIIKQFNADCGSLFTPNFNAVASINYTAILDSVVTVAVTANKTTDFEVDLTTLVQTTAVIERTRNAQISSESVSSLIAENDTIINATADIGAFASVSLTSNVVSVNQGELAANSEFTVNISAGNIISGAANMSAAFAPNFVYKVVDVDRIVYVIPAESRVFTINQETRSFTITNETRTYKIGA